MAVRIGDKNNSIDRISSLPEEILLHIVSFLTSPFDELRVSFVSTRFQKLCRSTPFLDCVDLIYKPHQFEKFMEKTLENHENLQGIRRFRLWCFDYNYSGLTISGWINSAATASLSKLQEITICVFNMRSEPVKLPCSVFSCQELKYMKLAGNIIVDYTNIPTTGLHFPCLKTVKLESISVVFDGHISIVYGVISNFCPVLEILHIEDCSLKCSNAELQVKYFRGSWVQGDLANNKVLKQMEIEEQDMVTILNFVVAGDGNRPVFEHLTDLEVKVYEKEGFTALPLLLEHSPNLTSLVLGKAKVLQIFPYRPWERNWEAPAAANVYKCLSCKLETVEIKKFCGSQEVEVVKYFLKNAKVLKKMVLCVARALSDEMKASIVDEQRTSAHCEIEFSST